MKHLLIEPAIHSKAYNIALMKWARWCENNNHEYQYVRGIVKPSIVPDSMLMSCVFTYYSKKVEQTIDYYLNMFPGVSMLVGGVFPSLQPNWFDKPKWNGLVEIHRYTDYRIEGLILNDVVLDPFSGGFTTTRVALKYGRKFVVFEMNKHSFDYFTPSLIEGQFI